MGRKAEFERDLIPTYGEGYSAHDMWQDTAPPEQYPFQSSWSNPNRQPKTVTLVGNTFDNGHLRADRSLN